MTTTNNGTLVVSDEARMALADAALSAARHNRPRYLLVVGVLLIAGAAIYAGVAFAAARGGGEWARRAAELTAQECERR
ncbi:MAG: hypothetical protein KIT68_03680 [Phycisphaeraceae bacterium]|nr:hypothetical protein [Phycisphaeraceae bacterium]